MPSTITDPVALANELRLRNSGGRFLIGVEGASQSGKTTLSHSLGAELAGEVVKTDGYYNEGYLGERYSDGLRLTELASDLDRLRGVAVVEGICLRDTLASIGQVADVFIYCKRLSPLGVWNDDPDQINPPRRNSGVTQERIDWWSYDYHVRIEPHRIADFAYERREA